jgi:hypothetical protein
MTAPAQPPIPPVTEAIYQTLEPDQNVVLYDGDMRITKDTDTMDGHGTIELEWEPQPRVVFTFEITPEVDFRWTMAPLSTIFEVKIELIGERHGHGSAHAMGLTTKMVSGVSWDRTLSGIVDNDFEVGNPAPTDTVIFHVPNFPRYIGTNISHSDGSTWAGRLTTTTTDWIVDIDSVPHHRDLKDKLDAESGYVISHIGCIRRNDGKPITYNGIDELTYPFRCWLTLLRGQRTEPILLCGVHDGQVVWERWRTPSVDAWLGRRGWLPDFLREQVGPNAQSDFGPIFQTLLDMKQDSDLCRVLPRAIDWYSQSTTTIHLDTRVILAQAGLEIMSWLRLVSEIGVDDKTFDKMASSDTFRLLLDHVSVGRAIPPKLPALHSAAQAIQPPLDGPGAVAEIRNGTVHPKAQPRLTDDQVIYEGGQLAMRYLEMLLLHRLGYMGTVLNRVNGSEIEVVPWRGAP